MWIFRNREVKRQAAGAVILTALFTAAAAFVSRSAALAVFISSLLWAGAGLFRQFQRYQEMRSLAEQIDEILHGEEVPELGHYQEGDLEILRNEIQKMTVRLREQAELLQREKLSLADALADISHQIRTPLTTLNLLLERLKNPELEERQKRSMLREAGILLERIQWLVTALLKMSKLDAGAIALQMQQVELAAFLREAMEPFEIPMEVHGKTYEIRGGQGVSLWADREWTMEAVRNVIKNGMEYTPDGGRLLLEYTENPVYTEIKITDSGAGIPQKDIPHLFERFYRGENAGKDSFGIGLALSRMILARENAVIQAGNSENGGGQFQIRFYKTVL